MDPAKVKAAAASVVSTRPGLAAATPSFDGVPPASARPRPVVRRRLQQGRPPMTPDEAIEQLAQLVTLQLAGDALAFNEAVAELDEDGAKYILAAAVAVMAQARGD